MNYMNDKFRNARAPKSMPISEVRSLVDELKEIRDYATLKTASFGKKDFDDMIKETVRIHHDSWIIMPLNILIERYEAFLTEKKISALHKMNAGKKNTAKFKEYDMIIPAWAVIALSNGDHSGLNDEEIESIDEFEKKFYHRIIVETKEDRPFFSYSNDFGGLACDCYNCLVSEVI
jgi:hypothetical protein